MAAMEVLIVEDNPADLRLTAEALTDLNDVKLHYVRDGEAALDFLKKHGTTASEEASPDLILLDLNLPKKDGRKVLIEIKQDPTFQNIPVVVFTDSKSSDDVNSCYTFRANAYVNKPSDLEEYFDTVRSIIRFWEYTKLPGRPGAH